jgi:uncharacterized membrane protein YgcG
MDTLCTPTIITGALFVAIIFNDLLRHEFENLPGHSMLGVVSVLLMAGLCQRGAIMIAWGLLLLPLTAMFIILVVQITGSSNSSVQNPTGMNTDEKRHYSGAFMYRDFDWSKDYTWNKDYKGNDTSSSSAGMGSGGGTGGSKDLTYCDKCRK